MPKADQGPINLADARRAPSSSSILVSPRLHNPETNVTSSALERRKDDERPCFLITIDTEGDNLWAKPREVTTHNSKFLPRFQSLCETHCLKPTYLTNYEMARCPDFVEFGREILNHETAEIGMHLHAWNTPPYTRLTPDDLSYQPYLIEYPEAVMREKVAVMTDLLEEQFGKKMTSHRAGRWGFNAVYARVLSENGYLVDCSVAPWASWRDHYGRPDGAEGVDYILFPRGAYFLDLNDIRVAGDSALLEVPMTIVPTREALAPQLYQLSRNMPRVFRVAINRLFPRLWLRPNGRNLETMLWILQRARDTGNDYVEFMLHSSELMPGGSGTFRTDKDIELLYEDMEQLFSVAGKTFRGMTLTKYYQKFSDDRAAV